MMRRIYAKVPEVKCKGLCQSCCGPIGMTPMEKLRLDHAAGHEVIANPDTMRCSALGDDGRCSAYDSRPLICRMWGAARAMPCEHGCEIVGEPLNDVECAHLVQAMENLFPGGPSWTLELEELIAFQERAGNVEIARAMRRHF